MEKFQNLPEEKKEENKLARELVESVFGLLETKPFSHRRLSEVELIQGNPNIGRVDFIRQIHKADRFDSEFNIEVTTRYQNEIFKYLLKGEYDVIFYDGSLYDIDYKDENYIHHFKSKDLVFDLNPKYLESFLLEKFKDYNPESPNRIQSHLLYMLGGGFVYSFINSDKEFYGVEDLSLRKLAFKSLPKLNKTENKTNSIYVMRLRERFAALRVMKYMKENPGKKVALIYGAAHDFRFDFLRSLPFERYGIFGQFGQREKDELPVLREISFPSMLALYDVISNLNVGKKYRSFKEAFMIKFFLKKGKSEMLKRLNKEYKRGLYDQWKVNKILKELGIE